MDFFRKLYEQMINEDADEWDLSKCIPVVGSKNTKGASGGGGLGGGQGKKQRVRVVGPIDPNQQGSGSSSGSSSGSQKNPKTLGKNQPQQNQPGDQEGGEQSGQPGQEGQSGGGAGSGQPKPGQVKQAPGSGKGTTITVNLPKGTPGKTGTGTGGKPVGTKAGKVLDDHGTMAKSDTTSKELVQKVYNETKTYYGSGKGRGEGTGKGGDLISIVEKALTPPFNVNEIKRRLSFFKESLKKRAEKDTYANPVKSQYGPIIRKAPLDNPNVEQPTAILIFAADVSGSITQDDYSFIFSFLDDIARQFKAGSSGVKGKVFLVEWDDAVHLPIRRWETVNDKNIGQDAPKQRQLKHGGGTVIANLFKKLDELFYREEKGRPYFVFNERDKEFGDINYEKKQMANMTNIKVPLRTHSNVKPKEPEELKSFKQGQLVTQEGAQGTSNVPFLVIYTDGYIDTPDLSTSKLYANNPGNIIYIVTQKDGIQNVRPRNFVYHNLHNEATDAGPQHPNLPKK